MSLSSDLLGLKLEDSTYDVAWRNTTNYAAAISDDNPAYFDDTNPHGIIAPPMFAVAVTWQIIGNLQQKLASHISQEDFMKMVHAGEHLIFHKAIIPADKLAISSEIVAVIPIKNSTMIFLKLIAKDRHNELVFTEFTGAMFRGVKCDDEGLGSENLPTTFKQKKTDKAIWSSEIAITRETPYLYDACSEIVFPIHTSKAFATMVGLPDIILQGTATLALAAKELVNREAKAKPLRLKELSCRFSAMILPDTKIKVVLQSKEIKNDDLLLDFVVQNAEGQAALKAGYAKISLSE